MEPSAILFLLLVLGFAVLVALAASRMGRKKRLERGAPEESLEVEAPDRRELPPERPSGKAAAQPAPDQARKLPEAAAERTAGEPAPKAREKAPEPPPPLVVQVPAPRPLGAGLERTRKEGFVARLMASLGRPAVDEGLLAEAEEVLLTADVGVATASDLVQALRTEFRPAGGDLGPQVLGFFQKKTLEWLEPLPHGAPEVPGTPEGPGVIMVVGVNGTGKTTTIGKMARFYQQRGRKVLLCAGDTYRAAGMDQLAIWGERVGVPVVVGNPNQDPGSLMFDAGKKARQEGFDLLIADTAGRLHTNTNLVEELKKIHRVLGKSVPGAPHEVLLVLDATMGQNAVRQADIFRQAVQVSGIVLAKLDGTAKGGVVLSIARDMGLPIRFVGVGEGIEDLRPFDPREFAEALFEPIV